MKDLPIKIKVFLITIYTLCIASLFIYIKYFGINEIKLNIEELIFFGVLMTLTESFAVYYKDISVSTSFAIQLTTMILFGPLFTVAVQIIGLTFRVTNNNTKSTIIKTPFYKTLFNYSIVTIPIILGSYIYIALGGIFPFDSYKWIPLIVFICVYFLTETFIISMLFTLLYGENLIRNYISNLRLGFLNILAMVPFALMLVEIYIYFKYIGVMIAICPILLVRYSFLLFIKEKSQYKETITALMHAMEARDKYTEGHSERVADLSIIIAKELKFSQNKLEKLKISAMLHDVGKIGIDDSILNKKGKLTKEEYEKIKEHPTIGSKILNDISGMTQEKFIVEHHHERYDGKGYPSGLSGDEICIEVYIVELADCIDAMATDRPYRKALPKQKILEEIKNNSGTQFNPKVVDAYLKYIEKLGENT
ncbi:MAG: HD-GYP domain-containing protein [Clostridiaceae bacterium]